MRTSISLVYISLAFAAGFFLSSVIYLEGRNNAIRNEQIVEHNSPRNQHHFSTRSTSFSNNLSEKFSTEQNPKNEDYKQQIIRENVYDNNHEKLNNIRLNSKSFRAQYFQDEAVMKIMGWNKLSDEIENNNNDKNNNNEKNNNNIIPQKGFFIEFGAGDGYMHSNSYIFEKELGWQGVCIEPVFHHYEKILKTRNCIPVHGAVCTHSGRREFTDVVDIQGWSGFSDTFTEHHWKVIKQRGWKTKRFFINCYTLQDILSIFHIQQVHYLAIDVEGHEHSLLASIDWDQLSAPIDVVQVEVNSKSFEIRQLMSEKGYSDPFRIDARHPDDIFIHRDLLPFLSDPSPIVGCKERCRNVISCDKTQWQQDSAHCTDTKWVK